MMADVTIKVLPNGPYLVEGEVALLDPTGQTVVPSKRPFALCRCGASVRKPFCDGSHSKVGFQAAEAVTQSP
jgi:3-phenylpropionate/trans-cinnamate dioxygenase ferredoxin subunit